MTVIHAHARSFHRPNGDRGRCGWRSEWEDVALDCDVFALPATGLCLAHTTALTDDELAARVAARSITHIEGATA